MRAFIFALFGGLASSQYFPPTPEGVTTVKSKFHEGVTISYKEVCYTFEVYPLCAFGSLSLDSH